MGLTEFLVTRNLGVPNYLWIMLFCLVLIAIGILIWTQRRWLQYKYYAFRFPERLIKVIIHFKGGYFKEFWRLIPDDEHFKLAGHIYKYEDKKVITDNDAFALKKSDNTTFTILGKKYNYYHHYNIKLPKKSFPVAHYYYNNPNPIDFITPLEGKEMSSKQTRDFEDNQLWTKLLNIESEKILIFIVIIICVMILIICLLNLAQSSGWVNLARNATTGG